MSALKYLSLLILPTLFVFAAIGCSGKPAPRKAAAVAPPEASTPKSNSSQPSNAYANMQTTETGGHIEYEDPKTGKLLWKADFDYAETHPGLGVSDYQAEWHGVHGVMYSDGKQADDFTAPLVTADLQKQVLTATGGVLVTSLTQHGTTLRCDRMVWNSKQKVLIGIGHAVFKKGGITQTMPSFQADTGMKRIVTPAPGLSKPAGHVIHTRIVHTHGAR